METSAATEQVRLGPAAAGRCRRRVHLDADPAADRIARSPMSDGARHRLADAAGHRDRVLHRLSALLEVVSGSKLDGSPGAPDAPAGASVVASPILRTPTRIGSPDLLVWAGDGYLPVLIRNHRTTDPGAGAQLSDLGTPIDRRMATNRKMRWNVTDALSLAHHVRLLDDLGIGSPSAWGGIIGRGAGVAEETVGGLAHDDAGVVLWYELGASGVLADYDRRFADRLRIAEAAAGGFTALAAPSRIGECHRCPWWPVCSVQLAASHDISMISAGDDVDLLRAAGVHTVDQLAALPRARIDAMPLTGIPAQSARVRARAWLSGTPLVRLDSRSGVPRADVELDVDMESYLDEGAYLWGTFLTGTDLASIGLAPGYRSFVTWNELPDRAEGVAFARFWAFLDEVRERAAAAGRSFAAYCYSRTAEERWMRAAPRRFATVTGMPSADEVAAFCASPQWVDIYQQLRDKYVVPGSLKLKALAPLAGFAWRDAEPGGENSMAWYRAAIGRGVEPPDPASAERVLQYNEDDVRATLALRRYLSEKAEELPTVADLDRD